MESRTIDLTSHAWMRDLATSARHPRSPTPVVAGTALVVSMAAGAAGVVTLLSSTPLSSAPIPELATAVSAGAIAGLLLERRALERRLRSARVRSIDAADIERQRIQRDLHDGAQQRIVSVKVHLALLAQRQQKGSDREAVDWLGIVLEDALAEIRSVTRDGRPYLLHRLGVPASLRTLAAITPNPVTIDVDGFDRYAPDLERTVYFCCVEALQNVVKHAGPSAAVQIRLAQQKARVTFDVVDSGCGFDADAARGGDGITNISDRVAALGGRLKVESRPGVGTRIRGEIPIA
jgi:signal transduction histidine kinase